MASHETGPGSDDRGARRLLVAIFLFGLLASAVMVARSQTAGDQLNLLARGWLLASEGRWVPFGNAATGGGAHPGGLVGLLVGLPLLVWPDHRAPTILMLAGQVLAYLVLDRLLRRVLRPPERVLFGLLYWLNPWRLFVSGFLWNPSMIFLPAALHLWTAFALRRGPRFWPSAVHLLVLGAALQLHVGALALVFATGLLWWRGYVRLDWRGAAVGGVAAALSFVPWLLAVVEDPSWLPGAGGFAGRDLTFGVPILKGLVHWLRFPGLSLGRSMVCLDFAALGGPGLEQIGPFLRGSRVALALPTFLISLWANWGLWRLAGRRWRRRFEPAAGDRAWLEGVVRWSLVAALATFALSPITLSYWQVLGIFHVAVLPVVLAAGRMLEGPRARWVVRAAGFYGAVVLLLAPALAFGAPPYRCGEPRCGSLSFGVPVLRSDHPMFYELGVHRTCPIVVDDPDGWWLDIVPEQGGSPPGGGPGAKDR